MANKIPQVIIIDEATEIDEIAFKKFAAKLKVKKKGKWLDSNKSSVNWVNDYITEKPNAKT